VPGPEADSDAWFRSPESGHTVAKTWDLLTDYQLRGAPSENGPKASPAIDRSCRILTARRWSASIRMRPKSLTKPRVLSVIV
jgi:hypothetical protein